MTPSSTPELTIFCLHYLGGSAREWSSVAAALDQSIRLVPIDLPGFGAAALHPGYSVESMALFVADAIALAKPLRFMLAGHSMGAKVATVLASWQRDGVPGLEGLTGLVLLAGSPPSPEPMSEDKRSTMSSWFLGSKEHRLAEAKGYISDNVGAPLDVSSQDLALTDVLTCNRAAWIAWLQQGSKEDWAARVGLINIPTLIVTGSLDEGLGRASQRRYMAPHFYDLKMIDLQGAGHLLPLERPDAVAQLINAQAAGINAPAEGGSVVQRYQRLILSERVGAGTREALLARSHWQPSNAAGALNRLQRDVLGQLIDRVIPQRGSKIDLAGRLDEQLATGEGDGWRFALLPSDKLAYQRGLDTLQAAAQHSFEKSFIDLDGLQQDDILQRAAHGTLAGTANAGGASLLNAEQMKKWFDDVRADATRLYMSHPDTLARVGYGGIANGGDGQPKSGFIRIGVAQPESWEPQPAELPS